MKHPVPDFLRPALVPVLGSDVAAGPASHVHLALIPVPALRAGPDQLPVGVLLNLNLPVKAALLAIVGLGIQLGIHNIVVNKLHDLQHRVDVVLHIGHLHIADGAAGTQPLELRLKGQLGERIDGLGHVDVIGVGDVALVGDAGDLAETLLEALGKLIGCGLQGRAVEAEVDVVFLFPTGAGIVHVLHHL